MQVSCKVSYSILVYIERQGVQLDSFFEGFDTPVEFLRDPSCWLEIEKMEEFLAEISSFVGHNQANRFVREVGQSNFDLRAWGVLDSVLKMVESPRDIFSQPERFLSYFLTPHPELTIESTDEHEVVFRLSRTPTTPFVLSYLIGAVEGLPNYMGKPQAMIEQIDPATFQIKWFDDQQSLFDEQEKRRRQFHPEIVQSVMASLQEKQGQSDPTQGPQEKDQHIASEAFERMVSLEVEKRMGEWLSRQKEYDETLFKIKNDFYKMYDYFTRAQQIITLVSPTARQASVREAMRRVDWDHVQKEFPRMVESACDSILSIKKSFHDAADTTASTVHREPINLNELIDAVVEKLSMGERSLTIDKQWFLDRSVRVEPDRFAKALEDVFNSSVARSGKGGELKIVTRAAGSKVQIEISDTGAGIPDEVLENIFTKNDDSGLESSRKIIEDHQGHISISSRQGVGSTYLIELPI